VRRELVDGLVELAAEDERIVLLTGDLGYTVVEPFAERFPGRFLNVGVAEQNMLGLATGLAEAGYVPFAYSIATFATMRAYEFIRNGPVLHELPVRIVGVGGGLDYGHNGVTHYALEDIALMRVQPGLTVVAPADPAQAVGALRATAGLPGPVYFRVGKESRPVRGLDGRFELGRLTVLAEGTDVAIVALGPLAHDALDAADALAARGISASVAVVASVAPPPTGDLVELLERARLAVTLEAHYVVGGLGSLVAEAIAGHGLECRLLRHGVETVPRGTTGTQPALHEAFGLTSDRLVAAVARELEPAAR
jgi:transketolase